MKNIKLYIFLLFTSCNIVPPTISWEDLNEDYEPQLNILGVITSSTNDSLNTSFIKVHRSLKVDEARDSLIRYIDETIFKMAIPNHWGAILSIAFKFGTNPNPK